MILTPVQLLFLLPALAVALVCTRRGWDVPDAVGASVALTMAAIWARTGALSVPLVGDVWSLPLGFAALLWIAVRVPRVREWLLMVDTEKEARRLQAAAHTTIVQERAKVATLRREAVERKANTGITHVIESLYSALPTDEWLPMVNDKADEAPHLFVYGPTGSGKTELAQAIAGQRDGGVVIIDPKPPRPGQIKWGGASYTMIDDGGTYTEIDTQLRCVRAELGRRLRLMKQGDPSYNEPLTVIVDEYKRLVAECESAPDLFLALSDIGRELGMRGIFCSQSNRVKASGIDGQGDTRDNFIEITLDRQHRATLEWDGQRYQLDTREVVTLARSAVLSGREWRPSGPVPVSVPVSAVGKTDTETGRDAGTLIETLRRLRLAGITRDHARAVGFEFRNEDWTEAGQETS